MSDLKLSAPLTTAIVGKARRVVATFHREGIGGVYRKYKERKAALELARLSQSGLSRQERFSAIYHNGLWLRGNGESLSGNGSSLGSTAILRDELTKFIAELQPSLLFDAPCGDFHWMKTVPLPPGCAYIGGDIVPALIAKLQQTSANTSAKAGPLRSFQIFDITQDEFPAADIWFCRDCLQHLSNADVKNALRNFSRSTVEFALLSNHSGVTENADIGSGECRVLDITLAPFDLPPPAAILHDRPEGEVPRTIAVWRRDQVAAAVGSWRA